MGIRDMFRVGEKVMGKAVIEGVERAVTSRWDEAIRRADKAKGATVEAKVNDVRKDFVRELSLVGAGSGGIAALPGAGTGTAIATLGLDIGLVTMRLADMIMTIGVLRGETQASIEERKTWVLSVLAFGDGAAAGVGKLASDVGKNLRAGSMGEVSVGGVKVLNKNLASRLIRRFGATEAAERFGRLMPFGIGAAIGAGLNGMTVHKVAQHADRFFREQGPAKAAEAIGSGSRKGGATGGASDYAGATGKA